MRILHAAFLTSAAEPKGWPEEGPPEIAVCGRSNVGKSSLLNRLLGRRALARVSQTPGRTRLLNFFTLRAAPESGGAMDLLLADLPGFGYAKVSKSERSTWRPLIQRYLESRAPLRLVILLCDARRVLDLAGREKDPTLIAEEEDLARWLARLRRRVVPVLTKADKLSKHERKPAAQALARRLGAQPVVFSALSGEGQAQLWQRVEQELHGTPATDSQVRP